MPDNIFHTAPRANIFTAFSALGEGIQGRGQQFLEGRQQLGKDRKVAALEDNRRAINLIETGDTLGAIQLGENRIQDILTLGGDPSDTQRFVDAIKSGQTGPVLQQLKAIDAQGISSGLLDAPAETLADIEAKAKARRAGGLAAERENIDSILSQTGVAPVATVLSGNEQVSDDARRAAGLFKNATVLGNAGQTAESNNMLSRARFIINNSPDIQRTKDLNKPISRELASELGVPVGTTLSEVADATVRSPEDVAAAKTQAQEQVKGKTKALDQLAFMDEGTRLISGLLEEIKLDPTVVGAAGSLRRAGQTVKGILSDLGADKLVSTAERMAALESDLTLTGARNLFRNPTLSTLDILENSIGFILARLTQGSGRLTVDVIKRSINNVKLKGLISTEQVTDRLNFIQELIGGRRTALQDRFGIEPTTPTTTTTETPGTIKRFKVENGALVEI